MGPSFSPAPDRLQNLYHKSKAYQQWDLGRWRTNKGSKMLCSTMMS